MTALQQRLGTQHRLPGKTTRLGRALVINPLTVALMVDRAAGNIKNSPGLQLLLLQRLQQIIQTLNVGLLIAFGTKYRRDQRIDQIIMRGERGQTGRIGDIGTDPLDWCRELIKMTLQPNALVPCLA